MGRVLLSGASGMLGSALREALAAEAEVVRLVRRAAGTRQKGFFEAELEWHPEAPVAFARVEKLEGLTAAIHLAGASIAGKRWTAAYKKELVESRVRSTRALAEALAGLKEPPRVLMVASGAGIYGNRGDEVLDESSSAGSGFLAELCEQWEAAARPAVEAGIRVVHLRTGVVLRGGVGTGWGALGKMLPIFRLGLGGPLGSGRQWMSWIGLRDWVGAVRFLRENESLAGPVNMVAPNAVTNAEFSRALGWVIHRPAVMPAPALALKAALGEMAEEALLASARVVPKKLLDAGFGFQYPEVEGALRLAVMRPRDE